MVLYTDGLVERRGESLDIGMERLRHSVQSDGAESMCRQVIRTLPDDGPQDDVAIVVIRRTTAN
jgi:sigma-B regulation protein RsbU (phosphoserine phosphatase)